ncbi:hypothetical protein AB0K74_40295 [Streptomyces sp. NPDC056159]|uniref:hypothetical protein n=1 Tax=Streptomyces sp. NPDC056159 TaxID=3155537 RepID=UPI003427F112
MQRSAWTPLLLPRGPARPDDFTDSAPPPRRSVHGRALRFADGTHRHQLSARYGLDRRIVRIALQHQQPREPMRRTPDPIALLSAIDPVDLNKLHNMLTR